VFSFRRHVCHVLFILYNCTSHKDSSIISAVLLIQPSHTVGRVTHNRRLASSASQSPLTGSGLRDDRRRLNIYLYTSATHFLRFRTGVASTFTCTPQPHTSLGLGRQASPQPPLNLHLHFVASRRRRRTSPPFWTMAAD
jgi:hypothetical protein